MIIVDRQVTYREIAKAVDNSIERVLNQLIFGYEEDSARWVLHLFSVDKKRDRMTIRKDFLCRFRTKPSKPKVDSEDCFWRIEAEERQGGSVGY